MLISKINKEVNKINGNKKRKYIDKNRLKNQSNRKYDGG